MSVKFEYHCEGCCGYVARQTGEPNNEGVRAIERHDCHGCGHDVQRLAALEAQLAEVTAERDAAYENHKYTVSRLEQVKHERNALRAQVEALTADLRAVGEAAKIVADKFYGNVGIVYGSEIRALRDAVDRPGVQAVLSPEHQLNG